jgi:hypothetical protein
MARSAKYYLFVYLIINILIFTPKSPKGDFLGKRRKVKNFFNLGPFALHLISSNGGWGVMLRVIQAQFSGTAK